jgi:hypothetical protein
MTNWEGLETDRKFPDTLLTCGCSERAAYVGPQEYETLVLTIRLMCSVHTVSTAEFEMRTFQNGLAAILSAFRLISLREDAKSRVWHNIFWTSQSVFQNPKTFSFSFQNISRQHSSSVATHFSRSFAWFYHHAVRSHACHLHC